jgi:hypothetical protein
MMEAWFITGLIAWPTYWMMKKHLVHGDE